jgi:8-oxo-dGTP diphosphatase
MAMPRRKQYCYEWPRPGVTVDLALFTVTGALNELRLQVVLIARRDPPFVGDWALPGGFVRADEDLHAAALRELQEETGIRGATVEQVEAVGTPGRDTRGHIITVVYAGLTPADRHTLHPSGDAAAVRWFDVAGPGPRPRLAFDHEELLRRALAHLRRRLHEAPILFELLPEAFTLSELQALAEALLGRSLDRRNFRRKALEAGIVAAAGATRREGAHRPAQLYHFVPEAFERHAERERWLPF